MKKLSVGLLTLVALAATTSIGCSDSKGSGDAGGITPLIFGAWYSYGDWYGGTPTTAGNGDCPVKGSYAEAQCSAIASPVPGEPFTSTGGKMCTSGTAAKVLDMNYSAIWGTGIGFDLDDGGTAAKLPWDATAHSVTGFAFDIDTPPVGGQMRVEFPTSVAIGTTDTNAAYWGGATANLSPFTKGGTYAFHWQDVGGPMSLTSPTPFDPTKILSMQFHVVTNTSAAIPFQYCISNVRALLD